MSHWLLPTRNKPSPPPPPPGAAARRLRRAYAAAAALGWQLQQWATRFPFQVRRGGDEALYTAQHLSLLKAKRSTYRRPPPS